MINMSTKGKDVKLPKPLPAPNSDFYQLAGVPQLAYPPSCFQCFLKASLAIASSPISFFRCSFSAC